MAKARSKGARALIWLVVLIAGLIGVNFGAVQWGGGSWTPELALDLEGGTQIVLEPVVAEGASVSQEQLDQAVAIIRQRVDASGVSEAEITTQGGRNIVVALPGEPDAATMQRIQASAKMEFRPVLASAPANAPGATPAPAETPAPSEPTVTPETAWDQAWITPELFSEFEAFQCADVDTTTVAPADEPFITCSTDGTARFILGPVTVEGADIADAQVAPATNSQGQATGGWAVNLELDGEGPAGFEATTRGITNLPEPQNQFAVVLDQTVLMPITSNVIITDGNAQIFGNFTQEAAQSLADQLRFGALPIGFQVQSNETISATLGADQLRAGLLAGLIGLVLVVVYSVFQYRALGLVVVLSLAIAAVLTYLVVTFLSSTEGYRLSLAGIAGLVISIGITADSFIVYFERIRDELREGKHLSSALETGWKRAFRTILVSDAVSFLAAVILFLLSVGNVRGFAYTLGITTFIDIVVVALFTHPLLRLLSRTRFFSQGHRLSGLDPQALGAVYRGRAKFREPVAAGKGVRSAGEAQRRQTIAERKAAMADATAKED
ncbi:protein translocase subunit SecD [Agrococcus sp. Marseille-Q4369]|uniref:protein translocase subunit SecD n=1 Tax=Agrococcus sp. Marseille-Q4369 TaxID=2810513 RepID=UPI001B8C05C9|nr:protein translocase subunit SecD [Agrococcus sp. Marseille-Q4369]QUW19171.1 protein translocase subunit SecD [Agrococcus sp. Marseille-Q4369]